MTLRDLRRLLLVYLSALAVLAASVVTSLVLTEMEAQKISSDAQRINKSGRQRTLSQRIIYLAEDLALQRQAATPTSPDEFNQTMAELEEAIERFEEAHLTLSRGPDASERELEMYFGRDGGGASLDDLVRDYLAYARAIVVDPGDQNSIEGLKRIEREGLLNRLDALVSSIEAQSIENVAMLRLIGRVALFVALAIVIVEVVFVFLPGHRMIQTRVEQIKAKNRELEDAWELSENLRLEQAEFTYAVSHDLKSPANTIKLILNELSSEYSDELSEDVSDLIFQATETVDRMGVQIEDILAYAWATGDAEEAVSVDIAACAELARANLAGRIRETGATLDVTSSARVMGYQRQIAMLIQNLVENGMKYQPPGARPVVTIETHPIAGTDGIRLCISDNGIGIAPENHEKIFGMFQRLHLRSEYAGSGLGLATCKRIVENHGGDIAVKSAPGEGATFEITLFPPHAQDAAPSERKAA